MQNINSYLESSKNQKIGFKNPYNELDALVLARISYLPFSKIKLKNRETIGDFCEKMLKDLSPNDFMWPDDLVFAEKLRNSQRFRDMTVTDYVRQNSLALEKQFSAITIHISPTKMYLSFFGTDNLLTAWKEDFNLAFMDHVPAQTAAKEYLEMLSKKYPLKRIFLGGHSKGGNLAMYAAVVVSDFIQLKIKKVYNYDGPGLRHGTMALDGGFERATHKIISVIPQDSVIGRLFEHKEKVKVVKSTAKGLYQHDIYSWQIDGKNFVRSKTTKKSDLADKTITSWIETASQEERKIFVNSLFEVLADAEINGPLEIKAKWPKVMPKILKAYVKMPRENKKAILAVWKKLGASFIRAKKGEK